MSAVDKTQAAPVRDAHHAMIAPADAAEGGVERGIQAPCELVEQMTVA